MSGRRHAADAMRLPRRLLAPEVIQTSAMDCGPAVLKSLLEGHRVQVSYGRLREACHTDVDGTSIDTLEELAAQLGLEAEQVMVPVDHVLLEQASILPAVAVVTNPLGGAHFIVVWRCHGPLVQVMDPARGRLWLPRRVFLRDLYVHSAAVSATEWRRWAGSPEFLAPLRRRLRGLGCPARECDGHVALAAADQSWIGLAALDAATRMIGLLHAAGTLRQSQIGAALSALVADAQRDPSASAVPVHYWSVRPVNGRGADTHEVQLRGAVLVRARGLRPSALPARDRVRGMAEATRSAEIEAASAEAPIRPVSTALRALRMDGVLEPTAVAGAAAIAAAGVVIEAVLLRSVLDVSTVLRLPEQGAAAGLALATFTIALLGLELVLGAAERRTGRRLESRLRMAFLGKIPRLADAYFQSRPVSDMLERIHGLHLLRTLPQLAARFLRVGAELAFTAAAIVWLAPESAVWAIAATVAAAGIPLLGHSALAERDLRVRTHAGALGRFQLDALLGRTALDAHGAGGAIEGEHERLLQEWSKASLALQRGSIAIEGLQMLVGFGLAGLILFGRFAAGDTGGMLLLAYWVLNLPAIGYEVALFGREYPAHRSALLRILEPLNAPEGLAIDHLRLPSSLHGPESHPAGIRIDASGVAVRASGHSILEDIDIEIAAGSHVAIVGASGAGKSTLVGLLLGWHRPSSGALLVDGQRLTGSRLDALRTETAWVDPSVQIWNRSLLDNLLYGCTTPLAVGPVLEAAGLLPVVARLPQGLATSLGEGGTLLSAGEAQRVRLGRAMLRPGVRLAVLDEPFLGLERDRRRTLLSQVRQRWEASTLLYVTHDIAETRSFGRVLVLERGRIVEDGDPRVLAQTASSRYRRLLQAQEAVHAKFAAAGEWRRIRVHEGRIVQDHESPAIEQTA